MSEELDLHHNGSDDEGEEITAQKVEFSKLFTKFTVQFI